MKGETTAVAASRAVPRLSAVGALVRRHDRDRYLTALFAPAERRDALFALYAFNYEIARVRESVTQPMLGQIRLQWWREVVDEAFSGVAPRAHVVAAPLAAAIRGLALSRAPLDRLIDARERDLDDAPLSDLAALETYAEGTSAPLVHLAIAALGVRDAEGDEVGRNVAIAYALVGLLRALPFHARAGRCYIPADIAAETGFDSRDYAALRAGAAVRRAVGVVAAAAVSHLKAARRDRRKVARAALPALLPAIVAERGLARLRRAGWNPFDAAVSAPDPLLPWRLAGATLRGRF